MAQRFASSVPVKAAHEEEITTGNYEGEGSDANIVRVHHAVSCNLQCWLQEQHCALIKRFDDGQILELPLQVTLKPFLWLGYKDQREDLDCCVGQYPFRCCNWRLQTHKKNERSPNKLGSHRTPLDQGPLSTSYQQQSVAASRAPEQVRKKCRQKREAKKRHQKKKKFKLANTSASRMSKCA